LRLLRRVERDFDRFVAWFVVVNDHRDRVLFAVSSAALTALPAWISRVLFVMANNRFDSSSRRQKSR
jgi:hypothetical protein